MAEQEKTLEAEVSELKAKLSEFRTTNVQLTEQLEKFGDISPTEAAEAAEIKRQRERQELVDSKDIDKALDAQEKKLTADFSRRFDAVRSELDGAKSSLRELAVTNVLKTVAVASGVRAEAVDDVVASYQASFEADGGELVHMADGRPTLSKKTAGANMGAEEFFEELSSSKPFYFGGSGGGGGEKDGGRRATSGGKRLITRDEFATGQYNDAVRTGDIIVEGYTEDVQSAE